MIVSDDPAIQAHYERCRREGTSHALAEMFAFGQPPMSNSDREFLEGNCNGNQFEGREYLGDLYRSVAESKGQNVKGKVYKSGLARFPGDPEAWVGGRGDVESLVKARGWDCQGAVTVNAREQKGSESVAVAPELVDEEVRSILDDHPEPAKANLEEMRDKVRQKRKPHWKR